MLCTYDKFYLQLSRYFFSIVYVCTVFQGETLKEIVEIIQFGKVTSQSRYDKRFKVFT